MTYRTYIRRSATRLLLMVLFLGFAFSPFSAFSQGPPSFKQRTALVIGNESYRHLASLNNPGNDAKDMCALLKSLSYKTICLLNTPTRRELRDAIQQFVTNAKNGGETFFYYAGHGVQSHGENYLIPVEANILSEPDIDFEGVGLSYLLQSLAVARTSPNIIILDACRNNPFSSGSRFLFSKGLARIDPPIGTILAYATSPNNVAMDGVGRNGLFTKHLLMHLAVPGVSLDEMFRKVAAGVEDEARHAYSYVQVPYRSSSYSAMHCIAGCVDKEKDERLKEIENQRSDLNRKLEQAYEENARLKAQAQRGESDIVELEKRIARLLHEEALKGQQDKSIMKDLEVARSELLAVQREQAQRIAVERENAKKTVEFEALRIELQKNSIELDEYRRRVRELEADQKSRSAAERDALQQATEQPKKNRVILPNF